MLSATSVTFKMFDWMSQDIAKIGNYQIIISHHIIKSIFLTKPIWGKETCFGLKSVFKKNIPGSANYFYSKKCHNRWKTFLQNPLTCNGDEWWWHAGISDQIIIWFEHFFHISYWISSELNISNDVISPVKYPSSIVFITFIKWPTHTLFEKIKSDWKCY